MFKRSLLTAAISAVVIPNVYSAPFMPMDARGLAMGNTGVATARMVHAPAYNPSLLSQMNEKDDFGFLFPHVGAQFSDEGKVIDTAQDISDFMIDDFDTAVNGLSSNVDTMNDKIDALQTTIEDSNSTLQDIQAANTGLKNSFDDVRNSLGAADSSIKDISNALTSISGNPLNARVGTMAGLAVPSKKFAVAVVASGSVNVSAKLMYTNEDNELVNSIIPNATGILDEAENLTNTIDGLTSLNQNELDNLKDQIDHLSSLKNTNIITSNPGDDLTSQVDAVAVGIAEIGVTMAREFSIFDQKISIGATPKVQKIMTYYVSKAIKDFDDLEFDDVKDSRQDFTQFNLDVGASYRFGGKDQFIFGLTGKNLISGTYQYTDDAGRNQGEISLKPQFRAGIGYTGGWFNIGADFDLTENKPVAFETATQYIAVGAEINAFDLIQLRAGYRSNLAKDGVDTVSAGFGISPFGVYIDVAAVANPSDWRREAGAAVELGFNF